MSDQVPSPAKTRVRSREELLRLLQDNPGAVSRSEIKAAFADGRLGEQDMDIPVLAGMRRITELLSELDHGPDASGTREGGTTSAPGTTGTMPPPALPPSPRTTPTATRIADLETHVEGLDDRLASAGTDLAEATGRVATLQQTVERLARGAEADRAAMATQARTIRLLWALLAVVAVLAVIALVMALQAR